MIMEGRSPNLNCSEGDNDEIYEDDFDDNDSSEGEDEEDDEEVFIARQNVHAFKSAPKDALKGLGIKVYETHTKKKGKQSEAARPSELVKKVDDKGKQEIFEEREVVSEYDDTDMEYSSTDSSEKGDLRLRQKKKPMKIVYDPRKAYLKFLRKVICLDGYFLKTIVGGVLLSAIGRDGNNQMFPLAWAVLERENFSAWHWFLNKLFYDFEITTGEGTTIISDQQKGLESAVYSLAPYTEHRNYAKHIHSNWKKVHKGEGYTGSYVASLVSMAYRLYGGKEWKSHLLLKTWKAENAKNKRPQ